MPRRGSFLSGSGVDFTKYYMNLKGKNVVEATNSVKGLFKRSGFFPCYTEDAVRPGRFQVAPASWNLPPGCQREIMFLR